MPYHIYHNFGSAKYVFSGLCSFESDTHKSRTPNFNFVVAGDFSCNKEAKKTVNNMATKKPEIVLTVGDHSYRKVCRLLV